MSARSCFALVFPALVLAMMASPAFASCSSPKNTIEAENCLPGVPQSTWDIANLIGDTSIQGFATDMSVNAGGAISFKVTSPAAFRADIYRLGYYQGNGARLVATIPTIPAQPQPACLSDSTTQLLDCGNWAVSASWTVPGNAVSGIYFARLVRLDNSGASHVFFIVRNDASHSDVLFQTSDATWQAYNDYSANLYGCNQNRDITCRAFKVSYNRPFYTRSYNWSSWVFNAEYPMVRWLEANGYDVSYISEVDTDRYGSLLLNHKTYLSVGHDEYWSGGQRANVEAARANGVNLAFFSGNEIFWKTRWENSIDGTGTPYRTLVCYKETDANARIDPMDISNNIWTGSWRDPRFSPPADGGRPENALSGTIFAVNSVRNDSIIIPQADGKMRFWRNTAVARLASGKSYTTPAGTLGYEWDIDSDNGARPAGLIHMSTGTYTFSGQYLLLDYGYRYGAGTATHHLDLYRQGSSLVFGAGTVQWSWGLDNHHDVASVRTDVNMQQATVNLLADMGAQPATVQSGLTAAVQSTDTTPPISTIAAPQGSIHAGSTVTLTGTAADIGGGVIGGVEVSVDGGNTWHPATGRESWSYSWTTGSASSANIRSRAADDSGNLEAPVPGITVNVVGVSSITVTPSNPTVTVGSTQQFTATGHYQDGSTQNITSQVTWSSSNTAVATISSSGSAKGQAVGSATISATYNGITGSTTITVQKKGHH